MLNETFSVIFQTPCHHRILDFILEKTALIYGPQMLLCFSSHPMPPEEEGEVDKEDTFGLSVSLLLLCKL